MNQISTAQWHVYFLICITIFVAVGIAIVVVSRVVTKVVRAESRRIEREWKKQRAHDNKVMMAESERLLRATAVRKATLDDALEDLLPDHPLDQDQS